MAVILLHPSLCLQASRSGILVWFSHGAALFPYHFPDALYCIFITAEAVSTGPSGYLFWDFYWILNKYVCHWGSLAGFLTYFYWSCDSRQNVNQLFQQQSGFSSEPLHSFLHVCIGWATSPAFFFFFDVSFMFRTFCWCSLGAFLQPSPFYLAAQLHLCGRQQVEWKWFSAKLRNPRLWVNKDKQVTFLQKAALC